MSHQKKILHCLFTALAEINLFWLPVSKCTFTGFFFPFTFAKAVCSATLSPEEVLCTQEAAWMVRVDALLDLGCDSLAMGAAGTRPLPLQIDT